MNVPATQSTQRLGRSSSLPRSGFVQRTGLYAEPPWRRAADARGSRREVPHTTGWTKPLRSRHRETPGETRYRCSIWSFNGRETAGGRASGPRRARDAFRTPILLLARSGAAPSRIAGYSDSSNATPGCRGEWSNDPRYAAQAARGKMCPLYHEGKDLLRRSRRK